MPTTPPSFRCHLHGLPSAIISDRDRVFTSQLWSQLFKMAQVQLRMSSAYHPQSDGQTERAATFMPAPTSGVTACILLSIGTTAVLILPWVGHPLKFCIGMLLPILAFLTLCCSSGRSPVLVWGQTVDDRPHPTTFASCQGKNG